MARTRRASTRRRQRPVRWAWEDSGNRVRRREGGPGDRAVSSKEQNDEPEDDAAVDGMGASGSSSVPSLAPFEELPRWAAGVQRERRAKERSSPTWPRLRRGPSGPPTRRAGTRRSSRACPRRCSTTATWTSASTTTATTSTTTATSVPTRKTSRATRQADEDLRTGRRAPSVVSLKPLDDDDDALYYAESEPGGAGAERSAPDAFGVVTTRPRREGFSGGSDVATDETVDETVVEATTPTRDAKDEKPSEDRAARPKGVFARVAAMLGGGKKPPSHLGKKERPVEAEKPLQTPCSEPPRSESPTLGGNRFEVPEDDAEEAATDSEEFESSEAESSDDDEPAVPLALRFDSADEDDAEDPTRRNPIPNRPRARALRDSFSGRWRRRAKREPLPVHELIGGGDVPAAIDAVDVATAIDAVEREDASRRAAAAEFAGGPATTDAKGDEDAVRETVEELCASLPRIRTSAEKEEEKKKEVKEEVEEEKKEKKEEEEEASRSSPKRRGRRYPRTLHPTTTTTTEEGEEDATRDDDATAPSDAPGDDDAAAVRRSIADAVAYAVARGGGGRRRRRRAGHPRPRRTDARADARGRARRVVDAAREARARARART